MAQTTTHCDFPGGVCARPPQTSRLHKSHYTATDYMTQEWENIWTRSWLFAGLESDLEEPGDYFIYELGRESIVIMMNDDEEISAFYNACQHRGNRIFASESGSVNEVVCPYHGWRYQTDGTLKEVPDRERFCQKISAQERSLKPVCIEIWSGLVWINMDPQAAPLSDYLGSFMSDLAPWHFEKLVLSNHQTVRLDANWKTAKDNFLEQYHVDFIHPQHASLVDCCNSENFLWPFGHSSTRVKGFTTNPRYPLPEQVPDFMLPLLEGLQINPDDYHGRVDEIREAVQARKRELGLEMDCGYQQLDDEQLSDVWQYDFFPNLFMTIQAEELSIYGPRPHPSDPNKCFFDKWTLQLPIEAGCNEDRGIRLHPGLGTSREDDRPEHTVFDQDAVINGEHSLTITFDQDIYHLRDMQAGMHSRGFDYAVLNQDESRVQHFHDWLASWLERVPEALAKGDDRS